MRDGDLKHRLCEIDGDGRMLHADSSLPWPQRGRFTVGTMLPHGRRSPFHRMYRPAPGNPGATADAEGVRLTKKALTGKWEPGSEKHRGIKRPSIRSVGYDVIL